MHDCPVLLFDVMDTLVYNPFNNEIPAFFGVSQAALLQQTNPRTWERFELGQIGEQQYFDECFLDQRSFDHAAFRCVVRDAYRWLDSDTVDLLVQLRRQGFEIHAFSNYPIWYQTIEDRLQLSAFLKWTFVSCRTGVRKPAADAYRAVIRHFGRPAQSLLFVDDSIANCQAAWGIGMDAIHYTDITALRAELATRGIPIEGCEDRRP